MSHQWKNVQSNKLCPGVHHQFIKMICFTKKTAVEHKFDESASSTFQNLSKPFYLGYEGGAAGGYQAQDTILVIMNPTKNIDLMSPILSYTDWRFNSQKPTVRLSRFDFSFSLRWHYWMVISIRSTNRQRINR